MVGSDIILSYYELEKPAVKVDVKWKNLNFMVSRIRLHPEWIGPDTKIKYTCVSEETTYHERGIFFDEPNYEVREAYINVGIV